MLAARPRRAEALRPVDKPADEPSADYNHYYLCREVR